MKNSLQDFIRGLTSNRTPEMVPANCTIRNGVLVSMEITSEVCVIPEGVREIKPYAINRNRDQIRELILPSTLRHIRENNFSSCRNLQRIIMREGVLTIGEAAFDSCRSLKKILLPDSLQRIDRKAFYGCNSLELVIFGNQLSSIGEYAFYGCCELQELVIPGSVKQIGDHSFCSCSELRQVTFQSGVAHIGAHAFSNCSSLKTLSFSHGLQEIEEYGFFSTGVENLTLPDGLVNCTPFVRQVCYNTCTKKWGAVHLRNVRFSVERGGLFLPAFAHVYPCRAAGMDLQLRNGQFDGGIAAAGSREDGGKASDGCIQVDLHAGIHREGADTAYAVTDQGRCVIMGQHFGPDAEEGLISGIIHPGISCSGNEHRTVRTLESQGLDNAVCFAA